MPGLSGVRRGTTDRALERTYEFRAEKVPRSTARVVRSSSRMSKHDVVVVGGGISGLTFAFEAARAGRSVLVLERAGAAGRLPLDPPDAAAATGSSWGPTPATTPTSGSRS